MSLYVVINEYLPVVYQGLIRTCSHPPVIEVVSYMPSMIEYLIQMHNILCLYIIIWRKLLLQTSFLTSEIIHTSYRTLSQFSLYQGDSGVIAMDTTDVLGNKRPSYLDYLSLWEHIMDPTKLKVCYWPDLWVAMIRSLSPTYNLMYACVWWEFNDLFRCNGYLGREIGVYLLV